MGMNPACSNRIKAGPAGDHNWLIARAGAVLAVVEATEKQTARLYLASKNVIKCKMITTH